MMDRKLKAQYIIKVLLLANRGRKFSGREISDFVNSNRLLGRSDLSAPAINNLVRASAGGRGMLQDVQHEKIKNRTMYWIE